MSRESKREPSQSQPKASGCRLFGTERASTIGVMAGARDHGEAESPSLGCRQDLVLSRLLESGFLE